MLLGFVAVILLEVPALVIAGRRRELRAFWVLLALSFLFSLGMVQRWPLPNPTHLIEAIFQPVADVLGLK
ncbi:MAG: hypothetical protein K0R39_1713 [Symbiobacteriaceae bacterium]|jgi:hypothetical protein|nr:hypothetical protein [Symbiobacteriaceae bacterium]